MTRPTQRAPALKSVMRLEARLSREWLEGLSSEGSVEAQILLLKAAFMVEGVAGAVLAAGRPHRSAR